MYIDVCGGVGVTGDGLGELEVEVEGVGGGGGQLDVRWWFVEI